MKASDVWFRLAVEKKRMVSSGELRLLCWDISRQMADIPAVGRHTSTRKIHQMTISNISVNPVMRGVPGVCSA